MNLKKSTYYAKEILKDKFLEIKALLMRAVSFNNFDASDIVLKQFEDDSKLILWIQRCDNYECGETTPNYLVELLYDDEILDSKSYSSLSELCDINTATREWLVDFYKIK